MKKIAIIGRPNVGKSTLFNRLVGRRLAIVHDQPGVTRDCLAGVCNLAEEPFEIIDTGGLGAEADPDFSKEVAALAFDALDTCDLAIFLVDQQVGLIPSDQEIARKLRRSGKPVVVAVNKADVLEHETGLADFTRLGFERMLPISAAHGRGIRDLVAAVEECFPHSEEKTVEEKGQETPRIAIVGRPNVGKSSLVNAMLGSPRTLVSAISGTTRDAVDVPFTYEGREFVLCDTAGLRHQRKHRTSVEVFSAMRSRQAIESADVCLLVIDLSEGVTSHDRQIAGLIQEAKKAVVLVGNKLDLAADGVMGTDRVKELERIVKEELFFFSFAPFVAVAAKSGRFVPEVFKILSKLDKQAQVRVGTGELNRFLRHMTEENPPPVSRQGRRLKFFYATQVVREPLRPFAPIELVMFVNDPELLIDNYKTFVIATIRRVWKLPGLPVLLRFRRRSEAKE